MKPNSIRRRLILTAALLLGSILPAAAADQTATWNSTTGNWSDFTKWSTNPLFPNNGNGGFTYDAIQNGGTLTVNQAITIEKFNLTGGTNTGAGFGLTLNDLLTFSGGTMNGTGTVSANGGATLSGGTKTIDGRVLNLAGSSTWTGGQISVGNNGQLVVLTGATLDTSIADNITNSFSPFNGTFKIQGTFNKNSATTVGLGTASSSFFTENSGVVNVNGGTLNVNHVSTNSGTWNVASGAALNFTGTHTMNAGSAFTGSGTVAFQSGSLVINAPLTTSTAFQLSGASLSGTGALTLNSALTFSGGTMTGTGTVNANAGATFSGAASKAIVAGRVLNLSGNSTWTGGNIQVENNAQLIVLSGATLQTSAAADLSNFTHPTDGFFRIQGTFEKSGATTTNLGMVGGSFFTDNTGTISVTGGILNLGGKLIQHSGTTLTAGTWNVSSGASISRTTGSDITTLGSAASVMLDGAGSSFAKVTTALATNQGSFTLKNNRDLTTAGAYANSGTTRVEDSTTVMTIGTGGASAYTQTGPSSVTILSGGAMIDSSAFNLNGGALRGTGTIYGPLTATSGNATTIAPGASPGTITINGSTMLGNSNTLAMEIGGLAAGIDYDVLVVNGVLTLGGLLDVDFINGFQNSVQNGDLFTIATATSPILGNFSNVASGDLLSTNFATQFRVYYGAGSPFGANNLVLGIPEPSRALLMLSGLVGIMMRRRRK